MRSNIDGADGEDVVIVRLLRTLTECIIITFVRPLHIINQLVGESKHSCDSAQCTQVAHLNGIHQPEMALERAREHLPTDERYVRQSPDPNDDNGVI